METAQAPAVTVDADAAAYAEAVGLRPALEHMLAAVPRLMPGLRSVHVLLKPDFDVPGRMNVICDVRMEATTKETYLQAYRAWHAELARALPRLVEQIVHLDLMREPS